MGLNENDRLMTVEEAAKYAERMAGIFEGWTKGEGGFHTIANRMRELAQDLREGKL